MRRRGSVLGVAVLAGLAVPFVLSLPGLQNLTAVLVLVTAVLAVVPLVPLFFGRGFDIFEPVYIFAASFAILFVVKPAWDLTQPGGVPPFAGESPSVTYAAALAIGAIGAAGFYVAYYWHRPPSEVASPAGEDVAVGGRLNAYVLGLVVLAAALYGALLVTSGGAGASDGQPSGYLYSAPLLLAPAGLLLILASPAWGSSRALAGISLVIVSQVPAFISGARSWTLPVLAAVVFLYYLKRRSRPKLAWIGLVSIPIFLLFVSAPRDYRGAQAGQGSIIDSVWSTVTDPGTAMDRFLRVGDTSMAANLAVELRYVPSRLDYQFGATYVEALMRPVPRALWPGKPAAADTELMAVIWPAYYAQGVGFSFSAFGEPYLNFGVVGVAVFGLLAGVACRALYSMIARKPRSQIAQATFAVSWPFVFVYMRGGIGVDYQRQLIILVPLLVGYGFAWRNVSNGRNQLASFTAASSGERRASKPIPAVSDASVAAARR
jgi:oligosaccharide repeat unit polymerase